MHAEILLAQLAKDGMEMVALILLALQTHIIMVHNASALILKTFAYLGNTSMA